MKSRKIMTIAGILLLLPLMFGCNHKELEMESPSQLQHTGRIQVVFDWSKAPQGNPVSMGIHTFEEGGEGSINRFSFANRNGGEVRLIPGNYDFIAYNNDNTDWARYINTTTKETFEIITQSASALTETGLATRGLPTTPDEDMQLTVQTPKMLWTASKHDIHVDPTTGDETIILYPEEAISYYSVTILNVKNIESLNGSTIDATLSGLSRGYHPGLRKSSATRVVMPLSLSVTKGKDALESSFLTFGSDPDSSPKHILSLYMLLSSGKIGYITYNVSDQVNKAPDPRHVDIVIDGLVIPPSHTNRGGFQPNVNDWEHENVDIKM